jgi:hypothetical protein
VFTSFTLSQCGMVRHWQRVLKTPSEATDNGAVGRSQRRSMRRSQAINATGAVLTALVLVVVFATKVVHGAWIAVAAMIVLFATMRGINRYYDRVTAEVSTDSGDPPGTLPSRVHAIVLVSRLHKPALRALSLARATRPDMLSAITLNIDDEDTRRLREDWDRREIPVPLRVIEAPYRDLVRPLVGYVAELHKAQPQTVMMVYIPEYVVTRWWQQLLHNQSALRLKARLLFTPGVVVVDVPYHLGAGDEGWLGTRHRKATPVTTSPSLTDPAEHSSTASRHA